MQPGFSLNATWFSLNATWCSLNATWFSLYATWYSLNATWFSLNATWFSLNATWFSLNATWFSLNATWFSLNATWFSLNATWFSLNATWFSLNATWFSLNATYWNNTMNRSTVLTKHQLMLETISSSRFLTGWTQHQKARPTTNLVRCWTFDLALVHLSNVLPPDRGVQQRTRFVVGRAPFQCFFWGGALLSTGFGCLKEPSGHSHDFP